MYMPIGGFEQTPKAPGVIVGGVQRAISSMAWRTSSVSAWEGARTWSFSPSTYHFMRFTKA
jgi:hypothetical protein